METPFDNTQSPSLLRLIPLALSTVPDNIIHAQQEQIADKPYKKPRASVRQTWRMESLGMKFYEGHPPSFLFSLHNV